MFYRLYYYGRPYTTTKYENLEEAKKAAAEANAITPFRFERVYVVDKFRNQVD